MGRGGGSVGGRACDPKADWCHIRVVVVGGFTVLAMPAIGCRVNRRGILHGGVRPVA